LTLRQKIDFCLRHMLAKGVLLRKPFTVKRLPALVRLYRRAYLPASSDWRSRIARLFFPICYSVNRTSFGEFEYERLGRRTKVRFNARNLQFQALYAPYFASGYEPDVAMLVDSLVDEGSTFFDVGSNWGYFSLYAASNRKQLAVHAFEAMPGTYRDLVHCVEEAGVGEAVTCHSLALSSASGEAFIEFPDGLHSGMATVSQTSGAVRIATRRLDEMNLPAPRLIKMDVEGHELEVMRGARELLVSERPFLVFENKSSEMAPDKTLEPLDFLRSLGYRLYIPVLLRTAAGAKYLSLPGGQHLSTPEQWALHPLEPSHRLLYHADQNVFACHESRLEELAAIFPG
jgi:FkbM family methyltransferase